jgi:predicted DNA repair protein MutK
MESYKENEGHVMFIRVSLLFSSLSYEAVQPLLYIVHCASLCKYVRQEGQRRKKRNKEEAEEETTRNKEVRLREPIFFESAVMTQYVLSVCS